VIEQYGIFFPDGLLMPRGIRAFATGPQMLHIPQKEKEKKN
jgi:hypothetical protein